MDFRQLESFLTVTKYNSFSKASRDLFLTQPALSNQIKNLERELKTPLFDRKGKSIELTPAGKLFRDYAIELIKKKETALFEINDLMDKFDGMIELPSSTVPGETIVPKLVSDFLDAHPGIKFKLYSMDTSDVLDSISDHKYSIGFIGSKPGSDFDYIKVFSDDMVFIGPATSLLDSNPLKLDGVARLPLIVREEGSSSGNIIGTELNKHGLSRDSLNIVAVTENIHVIKELVACNAGFAFVPRSSVESVQNNRIHIYELEDFNSQRDFYFIRHKSSLLTPIEEIFSEFVFSNARED